MSDQPSDSPSEPSADPRTARFEELMDFPAEVRLRAVGDAGEDLSARCAAAVISVRPDGLLHLDEVASKQGRFVSVRVTVAAASADQLRAYYAALHAVEQVRIVF